MRMNLTKMLNNRTIAVLAIIFIAIEAVPAIATHPNPVIFAKLVFWIFGAIFVWLNKKWAAIFLACLAAAYFIMDIILPIPQLVSTLRSLPPHITSYNPYIPHLIILSMIIEIVFLVCFMYYGVCVFRKGSTEK